MKINLHKTVTVSVYVQQGASVMSLQGVETYQIIKPEEVRAKGLHLDNWTAHCTHTHTQRAELPRPRPHALKRTMCPGKRGLVR